MSSLPDSAGVKKLRGLIRQYRGLMSELTAARAVAAKIESLDEEVRKTHREVLKVLEGMDCKSAGNAGWEQRITWMLMEMIVQEETDAAS